MLEKRRLTINGPTKSYTTESQYDDVDNPEMIAGGSAKKYRYTFVFCSVCGSHLAHEDGWHHDRLAMKIGTLGAKNRAQLMNKSDPLPRVRASP